MLTELFLSSGPIHCSMRTPSLYVPLIFPRRSSREKGGGFQSATATGHPPNDSRTSRKGSSPVLLSCSGVNKKNILWLLVFIKWNPHFWFTRNSERQIILRIQTLLNRFSIQHIKTTAIPKPITYILWLHIRMRFMKWGVPILIEYIRSQITSFSTRIEQLPICRRIWIQINNCCL